jgi:hypothetical protein
VRVAIAGADGVGRYVLVPVCDVGGDLGPQAAASTATYRDEPVRVPGGSFDRLEVVANAESRRL